MFEHKKTFGTSYALHSLLKQGHLFHSRPHNIISFILWHWKEIIIWYKFLLLLDIVFSEIFRTNFNPQFFKVLSWFEAFRYLHIRDAGGGPLKAE